MPLDGLHWFIDHAETISHRNIDRVRALGGGIAIQHRMAYQGEYFAERYGKSAAAAAPPIRAMLEAGVPVGAGTDATRVASYNPFIALYWLATGKTVGGTMLYDGSNRLSREEALMLLTVGSSWFSSEAGQKGAIVAGQLADLAVLSADYFVIPDDDIKRLHEDKSVEVFEDFHFEPLLNWWQRPSSLSPMAPPVWRAKTQRDVLEQINAPRAWADSKGYAAPAGDRAWGLACGCWAF